MDSKPLLDAVNLDDEDQVLGLLKTSAAAAGDPTSCSAMVNAKLFLPGWSGFTLLHWAAQRGHTTAMSLLLNCGANLDAIDDAGDTALHHAARYRRITVVELLYTTARLSLNLSARNKDGDTPLHVAAASGSAKIVKLMLACLTGEFQLLINEQNRYGDTPLHQAARLGNSLIIKFLLTHDSIDSTIRNNEGDTALHLAVARGKVASVEALLVCKWAANFLDARNKARLTPLLIACCSRCAAYLATKRGRSMETSSFKEIVELLVQEGADVNVRDAEGNSALHLAARYGNTDAITALLSSTANDRPDQASEVQAELQSERSTHASHAIHDRNMSKSERKAQILTWITHHAEAFEELDEISPSPNRKEYFYSTEWGLDKVPYSRDARLNLPNKEGDTPLHLAARHGHVAATETLLNLGASVNKLNKFFDSPLDNAFKVKHDSVVALLIRRGAELSDRIKHTLVELASAEVGKNELLPKPRSWDLHDLNLLHTIAMAGRTKILEALVEEGGRDVNARNEWKQTPLHCATILGKKAVVISLVERRELRANVEDQWGKTALQYAVECKHSEIEKVLLERMDVKESMDRLYRDRQVYIDAANAILVCAALIGGVTYSGWLQPPLGYVDQGYAQLSSLGVRVFWVCNSLSFCFAMCTVLAAAGAILPCPEVYIATVVREVRRVLALAAFLMAVSIVCVLAAFSAAGFAVVQKPRAHIGPVLMGASITPGVSIAVGLMCWFVIKMFALLPHWCVGWLRHLLLLLFHYQKQSPSPLLLPHHNHNHGMQEHHHHLPSYSCSSSPNSVQLSGML